MIRIGLWFDEYKTIATPVRAIRPGGPPGAILEIPDRPDMVTVEMDSRRLVRKISLEIDDNRRGIIGMMIKEGICGVGNQEALTRSEA